MAERRRSTAAGVALEAARMTAILAGLAVALAALALVYSTVWLRWTVRDQRHRIDRLQDRFVERGKADAALSRWWRRAEQLRGSGDGVTPLPTSSAARPGTLDTTTADVVVRFATEPREDETPV